MEILDVLFRLVGSIFGRRRGAARTVGAATESPSANARTSANVAPPATFPDSPPPAEQGLTAPSASTTAPRDRSTAMGRAAAEAGLVTGLFANPRTLAAALIAAEILDKPIALRE